jgi:tripartite ATP-independent transporter DctM subunit
MSIEALAVLMFVSMMFMLATGLPIAFVLGGLGLFFGFFAWGSNCVHVLIAHASDLMRANLLLACPLFIFMAYTLERSGIAEDLYDMMYRWMGSLRGGLAIGTVVGCTIVAAMSGISTTGVLMMGIVGLPSMLRRKYDKKLAMGCIMAGGALGPLIPPSLIMIIYSLIAGQSVGKLFLGGVFPGLLLSALFIFYIVTRCYLNPNLGPPLPPEERVGWWEKIIILKNIIIPFLLVLGVLGSISFGVATPTEAAAIGAFGAVLSAGLHRKLNWSIMREVIFKTIRTVCMVMWIIFGAGVFAAVFQGLGASALIQNMLQTWPVNKWVILILMQVTWFILGCLMDCISILLVTAPVFVPVASFLGIDLLWFGVVYVVNTEMGYLTPPFGVNLFVMRGITQGTDTTTREIYSSVWPFVALQAIGLVFVMIFPELITWLPNLLLK